MYKFSPTRSSTILLWRLLVWVSTRFKGRRTFLNSCSRRCLSSFFGTNLFILFIQASSFCHLLTNAASYIDFAPFRFSPNYYWLIECCSWDVAMPGHVKRGGSGEPDPDPAPFLSISWEEKQKDMAKVRPFIHFPPMGVRTLVEVYILYNWHACCSLTRLCQKQYAFHE